MLKNLNWLILMITDMIYAMSSIKSHHKTDLTWDIYWRGGIQRLSLGKGEGVYRGYLCAKVEGRRWAEEGLAFYKGMWHVCIGGCKVLGMCPILATGYDVSCCHWVPGAGGADA